MNSVDQLGSAHHFEAVPQRIISLVPSITELLCDLGLRQNLVGCTKFCVHPADLKADTTIVGGTKNVRVETATALRPDIVIASKEENIREQVEALAEVCPAWVSDVTDLDSAADLLTRLGELFGVSERTTRIKLDNERTLTRLAKSNRGSALYFIWRDPYMSIGGDTYINSVMRRLGYTNSVGDRLRYPALSAEDIQRLSPKHILLSSEPYPFAQKHVRELRDICPTARVELVDGELYSWYGSRLSHLS